MLPKFSYVRPDSTEEALEHLRAGGARVHAGGTDLLGCLHDGVFSAATVVSISGIGGLRGIQETAEGDLAIGALTTIAEIATSEAVRERYPGLAQAASEVASPQLRNQGTLGGNLCQRPRCWYFRGEFECAKKGGDRCYAEDGENRYHAILGGGPCYIVHPSDTAPMLVALGATVEVTGPAGIRRLPLEKFFVLPEDDLVRENVLDPGEIVIRVFVPSQDVGTRSSYRKVRERGAWDFALASLALALRLDGDVVRSVRIVLGGVAPIPWRVRAAEEALLGRTLSPAVVAEAKRAAVRDALPLEQNAYKLLLVEGIIEEALLAV